MARNYHIVENRKESSLENSRAKVTPKQLDEWFEKYKKFVSQLHLLDQPQRIYNTEVCTERTDSKSKYLKSSQNKTISECAMSRKQKSTVKSKPSLTKPSTSTSVTCTRKTSISVES